MDGNHQGTAPSEAVPPGYITYSGDTLSEIFPLCSSEEEITIHFLPHCSRLQQARHPYLLHILHTCQRHQLSIDPDSVVKAILGSSYLHDPAERHEETCWNMVYELHHHRVITMGGQVHIQTGTITTVICEQKFVLNHTKLYDNV